MAQHLKTFLEDFKRGDKTVGAKACETCKYANGCDLDFYSKTKTLTELTGITFDALIRYKP